MTNKNKCRVCLADEAEHLIFENIESKESIHSKLCQCFKQKIEDIEGYPKKICESCNDKLHTVWNFITMYQASCKLLESNLIVVKKEFACDNDSNDVIKQELEFEICKNEPDSDGLESPDESVWDQPLAQIKKQEASLTDIKSKLKSLKEIKFKRKPKRKNKTICKAGKTAFIQEAEFDWNVASFKSSKLKESCEKRLKEKRKHNKTVPPKSPKPPPAKLCDICGEIFKESDELAQHKQRKHFSKPMKCPKCPRTLVSEYYLKRHIKRVHENKTFICDTCGNGFAYQGELNSHTRVVHLKKKNKKDYSCDKCDKVYTNAKSLLIHERSVHTGIRPAECTECGASFYHEDYLKEHMRLHTGETPFKCPICGRGYAQRGNMRSHMSHNHRLADLSLETISKLKPGWFRFLKKQ